MSEVSETSTTNVNAEAGSTAGIVAGIVHNSTVYISAPTDPPAKKYEVGCNLLNGGEPAKARHLIRDAIAHDYDSAEVRFHWVLALLSKRSYRDLNAHERDQLEQTSKELHSFPESEWKRALSAVCKVLEGMAGHGTNTADALADLFTAQPEQRDKVMRHLDLVLTGGMKDRLWSESREAARKDQASNGRFDRVWAYFHPVPIKPRTGVVDPVSSTDRDHAWGLLGAAAFVVAVGYIGWLVLLRATPLPVISYILALVAGYVSARNALEWRYRVVRLRSKEETYFGPAERKRAPEDGFANDVDRAFDRYFNKYRPQEENFGKWLAATAGIRNKLRDEIVQIYRESRSHIGELNWLIAYLVLDVRKRWRAGTLFDFQQKYRANPSTKAWCSLTLMVAIPAGLTAVAEAFQAAPLPAVASALVAAFGGRTATTRGFHIMAERRRYAEESLDQKQALEERWAAYAKWKAKLDSTRPDENEMETWLNCDKTLLLDRALRHYRLEWRDIIAHSFLQTPASGAKRARFQGCPWRYSRYEIRLFLVTSDGVREVSTELHFEKASFKGEERSNYRFDAVSSVHVAATSDLKYTLELTLSNGPVRNIRVAEPDQQKPSPEENIDSFIALNLETAGFTPTLHILEGIAAEGKNWIHRQSSSA